jgi:hypothetical protein
MGATVTTTWRMMTRTTTIAAFVGSKATKERSGHQKPHNSIPNRQIHMLMNKE